MGIGREGAWAVGIKEDKSEHKYAQLEGSLAFLRRCGRSECPVGTQPEEVSREIVVSNKTPNLTGIWLHGIEKFRFHISGVSGFDHFTKLWPRRHR